MCKGPLLLVLDLSASYMVSSFIVWLLRVLDPAVVDEDWSVFPAGHPNIGACEVLRLEIKLFCLYGTIRQGAFIPEDAKANHFRGGIVRDCVLWGLSAYEIYMPGVWEERVHAPVRIDSFLFEVPITAARTHSRYRWSVSLTEQRHP